MRVSKKVGPSSTLIRVMVRVALILVFLWGIAGAVQRFSPGYLVWIDSLNTGGGISASPSFLQMDSAVGQESVCGLVVGASFQNQAGVIQPWVNIPHTAAHAWNLYH
jgi:hypothetical protein